MNLQEVFPKKHMIADLKASQKLDTLQEIVAALAAAGAVKESDVEDVERAIMRREELGSTGIGKGVAVPHAKHSGVKGVIGAFARSSKGIDFDSLDGHPVNLVFMLISSPESVEPHLAALRKVTMLLRDDDICAFLKRAATTDELANLLIEADERLEK